jgi:phosphate transport system permease protein
VSRAPTLRGKPRRKERAIRTLLAACGLLSVVTTVGIVLTLGAQALAFFRDVPFGDFLTGTEWSALISPKEYGVLPLMSGTLMVVVLSSIVGIPLGVGTALYMSEYASPRVRRRLKPFLEVLAGIPTVVLGYFALSFVSELVVQRIFPGANYYNGLSAGITVGIMIVPIIASVSEDAMSAVPRSLREGAYGLGATRMAVGLRVVLPAALSGIMASIILGVSRAVGETMVVAIAMGTEPKLCLNPLESCQTLTGYIVQAVSGDVGHSGVDFTSIFAVGAALFVVTFGLNALSLRFVRRFRQAY